MVALPTVGGDNNAWGTELNTWALVEHNNDGTHNFGTPAKGEILVYDDSTTPKLFAISHKRRLRGYRNFKGDAQPNGTGSDDSAVWNQAITDAGTQGFVEMAPDVASAAKNIVLPTRVVVDLNGGTLQTHSSITTSDDLIATTNFNSLTGTTTDTTGGAPYGFELLNGFLYAPGSNNYRSLLSIYGVSYRLSNLTCMHTGIGPGIQQEYGSSTTDWTVNQPSSWPRGKSVIVENVSLLDGVTTAGVNMMPSANDMSINVSNAVVSGGTTLTVTTARTHLLAQSGTYTVTLASIGGITGASGTFTATPTANNQFTVTGTFSGTYTSGGTVTYHVSAAWANLGPSDQQWTNIYAFATTHVRGRRGILWGTPAGGNNSAAGCDVSNIHIYNNWDVAADISTAGSFNNVQFEGSFTSCCLVRKNGRTGISGRIYGGFGGVVLLSLRDANQCTFDFLRLHQAGSGNAPPSGWNNIYFETYNGEFAGKMMMEHDYNTNAKAASGIAPTNAFNMGFMNAFGISTATLSSDWGTAISATKWGDARLPSGLTWVTA